MSEGLIPCTRITACGLQAAGCGCYLFHASGRLDADCGFWRHHISKFKDCILYLPDDKSILKYMFLWNRKHPWWCCNFFSNFFNQTTFIVLLSMVMIYILVIKPWYLIPVCRTTEEKPHAMTGENPTSQDIFSRIHTP